MNSLESFFSSEYLLTIPTTSKYEDYLLYISIAILIVISGLKVFFIIKKRSKAFKNFDRLWLWGYLVIGLSGLFVWFSRNQQLPMFGTRAVSYIWLNTIWLYGAYLFYYYKKHVNKSIESHYEKKRKEKYLK